ncbi:MAG: MFS transporter [Proteobacteria bacterium]|nr:MFS transporter [Pseudomonadota bacterium]
MPEISKTLQPVFTTNFILVTIINLFVFFSFQMIFPTLPLYIKSLGGTDSVIGLVMGTFMITSLATQVFIIGLVVLGLSAFAYSLAASVTMIVFIRLLHGFGWGIAGTATSTVAAEIIPRERFGEGMGYFSMANSLSLAIAPAAGLYISHRYGFRDVFMLATVLVIIGLLLALLIRYRKYRPQNTPPRREALYEKSAFGPAVMVFFVSATFGGTSSFLPLYAYQRGVADIGVFFTVYALAVFVSRPLTGKMVDRYNYDVTIVPGLLSIAGAMLIISYAHSLSEFLIAAVIYGFGFGTCQMSLQTMVLKNVRRERLGAANATFFSGVDVGMGLGALTLGSFAEIWGYSDMFIIASSGILLAFWVYVLYIRRHNINTLPA